VRLAKSHNRLFREANDDMGLRLVYNAAFILTTLATRAACPSARRVYPGRVSNKTKQKSWKNINWCEPSLAVSNMFDVASIRQEHIKHSSSQPARCVLGVCLMDAP